MGAPIQAGEVFFEDETDDTDRQNVYVLGFHEELKDYVDVFNNQQETSGSKLRLHIYSDQIRYKELSNQ